MKKIFFEINKLVIGVIAIAVSLTSCKKLIEIPANPPSSITQQQQFTDSATTITAVAGVYAYNVGNGFGFSDGHMTYVCGLSADELSYAQSNDNQQFYNYSLTPLNNNLGSLWGFPYQSIYQVNAVMDGVSNNAGLSPSFKKQITGEMDVVRALYYFNMVNLFGGVPKVTSTDYNETARLPRASSDAIYDLVISDLLDAKKKLTAAYPSVGRARPNLYAAQALLAKVYLYKGDWQNAFNEADAVISSGLYDVANTPLSGVFLDGSNEAIWQLPANQGYYGVSDAQNFIPNYPGAIPNYLLTKPLLDAFDTGDQRLPNWISSTVINGQTLYYPAKYKNVSATATPTEDQMVIRLAEVYLIHAEASARLNNLPQALADVNIIRVRAGLGASTANVTSQDAVLNAIMHERQVELFCEWGNRWFDLKRNVTPETSAATILGAEKTGYTANAGLYPIPQAQILLNNLLKQNPGY